MTDVRLMFWNCAKFNYVCFYYAWVGVGKAGAGSFSGCHTGATAGSMEIRCGTGINRSINQFYYLEIMLGGFLMTGMKFI